jgi:hypothetical protein
MARIAAAAASGASPAAVTNSGRWPPPLGTVKLAKLATGVVKTICRDYRCSCILELDRRNGNNSEHDLRVQLTADAYTNPAHNLRLSLTSRNNFQI